MSIHFDTIALLKSYEAAGISRKKAESIVKQHDERAKTLEDGLVTKEHFDAGMAKIEAKIAELGADLYRQMWITSAGVLAILGTAMIGLKLFA